MCLSQIAHISSLPFQDPLSKAVSNALPAGARKFTAQGSTAALADAAKPPMTPTNLDRNVPVGPNNTFLPVQGQVGATPATAAQANLGSQFRKTQPQPIVGGI